MSNLVYPSLPGLKWSSFRTPMWNSTIRTTDSGREFALSNWSSPRWAYKLQYEFLRGGTLGTEYQQLVSFFNKVRGNFDTWLFDDVDDNTATNERFGTGDATTLTFQLARSMNGFAEAVYELSGTPLVYVNGVLTACTVGANGAVTFGAAPAVDAALTWTGQFFWRCRFKNTTLEFEQFMKNLWATRSVEFTTVKP